MPPVLPRIRASKADVSRRLVLIGPIRSADGPRFFAVLAMAGAVVSRSSWTTSRASIISVRLVAICSVSSGSTRSAASMIASDRFTRSIWSGRVRALPETSLTALSASRRSELIRDSELLSRPSSTAVTATITTAIPTQAVSQRRSRESGSSSAQASSAWSPAWLTCYPAAGSWRCRSSRGRYTR